MDLLVSLGLVVTDECKANILQSSCLTLVLSKLVGYLIILGAIIVKVPQILKLFQVKSAEGVSGMMFNLEILGYSIAASYGFAKGFPFSTYGENFPLALQNVVILFLIATYTNKSLVPTLTFTVALVSFFVGSAYGMVPLAVLQMLQTSTIFTPEHKYSSFTSKMKFARLAVFLALLALFLAFASAEEQELEIEEEVLDVNEDELLEEDEEEEDEDDDEEDEEDEDEEKSKASKKVKKTGKKQSKKAKKAAKKGNVSSTGSASSISAIVAIVAPIVAALI